MTKERGGNGRYTRSSRTATRDAHACRLRSQGLTYQEIATQLSYASKSSAYEAVQRALKDTVAEPAADLRELMRMQLDELAQKARTVMETTHYLVDKGTVVQWQGQPLIDSGPVLASIDRLVKIQESRRKLDGLDSPQRVSIDAQQLGDDIKDLIAALGGDGDDSDA